MQRGWGTVTNVFCYLYIFSGHSLQFNCVGEGRNTSLILTPGYFITNEWTDKQIKQHTEVGTPPNKRCKLQLYFWVTLCVCRNLYLSHYAFGQTLHWVKLCIWSNSTQVYNLNLYQTQKRFTCIQCNHMRMVTFCMWSNFALGKTLHGCF